MRSHCSRRLSRLALSLLCAGGLSPGLLAQNRQIELEWLRNAGQSVTGTVAGELTGTTATCAGDVNGDGFDDLLIATSLASPVGIECGQAWIVHGGPDQTGPSSLSGAAVVLNGNVSFGHAGQSVAAAGDVNQDGFDDVLIGAPGEKPHGTGSGQAYLVYGGASMPATISLAALGSAGVTFNGIDFSDIAGSSVAGAGDVNGDTFPDVAVGAPGSDQGGVNFAGETYIVYGGAALPAVVELSALTASTGCTIRGIAVSDKSGDPVAGAGDVNGDGKADLLIGAPHADPSAKVEGGQVYLVYGSSSLPAVLNLSALGAGGVIFNGNLAGDQLGTVVGRAGDVNGDGKSEALMSAPPADPATGVNAGIAYMLFGSASLPGTINMGSLGALGVTFPGRAANYRVGNAFGGGGDVNRDGLHDFVICENLGSPNGDGAAGEAYLIYGATSGWPTTFDLNAINQRGVVLAGIDPLDNAGYTASLGDVNNDGAADVVLSAPRGDAGAMDAGETTVVYGGCHFLQAVGPAAEGGSLNLRAHGNASQPMEMMFSPFLLPNAPIITGLGPYWLGSPLFEVPLGNFGSNGEFQISFPLPPPGSGIAGLTLYVQFLGKPQGKHCDLTYLLAVTIE